MLMLKAYMDESSDGKKAKVQCIGGMLASTEEWNCVWDEWVALVQHYGITELHMADCVAGKEEFARFSEPEREEMQSRFISIITKPGRPRIAQATTVFLATYPTHRAVLDRRRQFPPKSGGSGSLGDPYFLAFEHSIQEIATDRSVAELSDEEEITFIFDQGPFQGKAGKFYELLLATESSYRERLGTYAFASSAKTPPLQVADVIAFEYRRYHQDVMDGRDIRPQAVELAFRFGGGWKIEAGELARLAKIIHEGGETKVVPAEMLPWPESGKATS